MPLKKTSKTENNFKKLLIAKGMSMKALAYTLGISTQQIQKYVSGENEPTLENLAKIAGIFGCRIQDIYPFLKDESIATKHGKNVTINHYYGFLSGVLKMDMSLLKNKIIFLSVAVLSILAVVIATLYPTLRNLFADRSDAYAYLLSGYYWSHFQKLIVALLAMIVYTLAVAKNFFSYVVSYIFFSPLIFQIHYLFFGLVGESEVKRTFLRILGVVLAIIWVQIAKKIREKV